MPHTICSEVTWQHSRLNKVLEGNGEIWIDRHDGGTVAITGMHHGRGNASLLSGKCDGTFITFAVVDPSSQELICYLRGEMTSNGGKDFIKGKFSTPLKGAVAAGADDWEADKTT